MAADATKVLIGQSGTVLWGTIGVTLPAGATAATTGFNDLGYLDENGVTFTVTPSIEEFNVWQATTPIRRIASNQAIAFSGAFAEWNSQVVPLVFGGGTTTVGTYSFPETSTTNDFAGVIDVADGSNPKLRFVFSKANQTESVESQFNKSNLSTLAFNFGVLAAGAGTPPLYVYRGGTF